MNNKQETTEKPVRQRKFFIVEDKDEVKLVFNTVKERIIGEHPMLAKMPDAFFMRIIMKSLAACSDATFRKVIVI